MCVEKECTLHADKTHQSPRTVHLHAHAAAGGASLLLWGTLHMQTKLGGGSKGNLATTTTTTLALPMFSNGRTGVSLVNFRRVWEARGCELVLDGRHQQFVGSSFTTCKELHVNWKTNALKFEATTCSTCEALLGSEQVWPRHPKMQRKPELPKAAKTAMSVRLLRAHVEIPTIDIGPVTNQCRCHKERKEKSKTNRSMFTPQSGTFHAIILPQCPCDNSRDLR